MLARLEVGVVNPKPLKLVLVGVVVRDLDEAVTGFELGELILRELGVLSDYLRLARLRSGRDRSCFGCWHLNLP